MFRRISTHQWRSGNKNSGYFRQSDPKDIPMHVSAKTRTRVAVDSKREVPLEGTGILHVTEIEIFRNPRCSEEIGDEHSTVAQKI